MYYYMCCSLVQALGSEGAMYVCACHLLNSQPVLSVFAWARQKFLRSLHQRGEGESG